MTRDEFLGCMSILSAGIGKPIADGEGKAGESARKARLDVYYDLLGDLHHEALKVAVRRVLVDHKWNTFPSIAELRAAAVEDVKSQLPSPGEAWKLAQKFASAYDPEQSGPFRARPKAGGEMRLYESRSEWLLEGYPEVVVEAMRQYGFSLLANTGAKYAMTRFFEVYEEISSKETRKVLMPASTQRPAIQNKTPVKAIGSIGQMPKEE